MSNSTITRHLRRNIKSLSTLILTVMITGLFNGLVSAETLSTDRPDFGDYYGNNSNQYEVTGTVSLQMTDGVFYDDDLRNAAVDDRLLAVETYLAALITDKYPVIFVNFDYGNFKSTVRHETMRAINVYAGQTSGTYNIDYAVMIAGPKDLIDQMGSSFNLSMPANATGSDYGFPLYEIRRFNPSTEVAQLEEVLTNISEIAQSSNSYPEYDRLLEDDVLNITMWAGYDYTQDRIDLWASMRAWIVLFSSGFEMQNDDDYLDFAEIDQEIEDEVQETMGIYYPGSITDLSIELFARMKRDAVFSKQVTYKGRTITVNVKLQHRNLYEGENEVMKAAFLSEARTSDILIYNGHAGAYYGWYLGPESDAFLGVDAIATAPLDADRYQIMIISGCQTYSTYAEHFFRNPAKNTSNLDVVTTVNWIQLSHGERAINSILDFFVADTDSQYQVFSYGQILNYPNNDVYDPDAFWATQGTNDNPVVNPLANVDMFSNSCSVDADCGDTPANRCTRGQCSVQSMSSYVCPDNYDFIDPYGVWGAYCAPASCPQFLFEDGQIYIDDGYAPNECSNSGLSCPGVWSYGPDKFVDAACVDGQWAEKSADGGFDPATCPNSILSDGNNMYNADREYGENQCATNGATCPSVYFYAKESYEEGICENNKWIDSASAGNQGGGQSCSVDASSYDGRVCLGEVALYSYQGTEYVVEIGDASACSDSLTRVLNCDATVFCNDGGIAGLSECTDFFAGASKTDVVWTKDPGNTGGEPEVCPNTVFTNGFIYNGDLEYVANSCASDGQVCTTTSYFYSESAHLPAMCDQGTWEVSGGGDDGGQSCSVDASSYSNNSCLGEVALYSYQGTEYVVESGDGSPCSDSLTTVLNCDSTVFCYEGGIAGFNQCSDFFAGASKTEVVWTRDSDNTGGKPEVCPNTVFTNGFIYNGALEYVQNSCSLEGQVCTTTSYFYSVNEHLPATCAKGLWVTN